MLSPSEDVVWEALMIFVLHGLANFAQPSGKGLTQRVKKKIFFFSKNKEKNGFISLSLPRVCQQIAKKGGKERQL